MKRKKIEHKNLYREVRRISKTHDLMGLLKIGDPADEYDPETSLILPLIYRSQSADELAVGIANVYNKMFDTDFNPSDEWISKMAADIFKLK